MYQTKSSSQQVTRMVFFFSFGEERITRFFLPFQLHGGDGKEYA